MRQLVLSRCKFKDIVRCTFVKHFLKANDGGEACSRDKIRILDPGVRSTVEFVVIREPVTV